MAEHGLSSRLSGAMFPTRRSREPGRFGGGQAALSDTISRIFTERASFELRDDDVEALRKQLRNGGSISPSSASSNNMAGQEAEELEAWKVRFSREFSPPLPQ